MKFSQRGRVAVVTGASQGIAEVFAQAGATAVVAARNRTRDARVVANIEDAGGSACFVQCDIGTIEGVERLVAAVLERFGRIDVLVHNAGVFPMVAIEALRGRARGDAGRESEVGFPAGEVRRARHAPAWAGANAVTSSVTGPRVAMPLLAHYAASKAGLNGFIRAVSLEYARDCLTVNAVEPGYIRTQAMDLLATPQEQAQMVGGIPLGRLGHRTTSGTPCSTWPATKRPMWPGRASSSMAGRARPRVKSSFKPNTLALRDALPGS